MIRYLKVTHLDGITFSYKEGKLKVKFARGRQQDLFFNQVGDHYRLWSIVLTKKDVKDYHRVDLLQRLWHRNRHTDVVSFYIDEKGKVVGSIVIVGETLTNIKLALYAKILASECDHLEKVLILNDQE